jgi:serine/threonine protein kinase
MQTIGRYQIHEKLGQGGMGIVYRAFDSLIERVVAIKVISSPVDLNPEMRERFFREARAAGQLSHKNIITIHDLGEHEGQPYLAMEYLDGEDLQRRLKRPEKMSLSRKIDLAIEICEGLEYAHSRGVIHRDIKPANIFITDRGTAKVLDFGLARLMTSQLTNTNMLMGTLNYMAPEQVRGERADQRSDVFSVGVVLYELLCGKKAFEGDSFASTLYKILQEVPEPLWKIDSTLPRELIAIVERALAKPKDERYQQMSELRSELVAYRYLLHGDSMATGTLTPPSRPSSDARRLGRPDSSPGTQPVASGAPAVPVPTPAGPMTPVPTTPVPSAAPQSGGPVPALPRQWSFSFAIRIAFLLILATGAGIWFAQRRLQPAQPPATAAVPVDPLAEQLRQAQQALQAQDYAGAERLTETILRQAPQNAEARRIHDAARDAAVDAALQKARTAVASGDYAEASRAAGEALALAPGNAEAKGIMEQGSARDRARGADEARLRMAEAKSAAVAARAPALAGTAYRAATRAEQDSQRLYKTGRLADATTCFYEASGLFRGAETSARNAVAAPAPTQVPAPTQAAPSASPAAPEPVPETSKPLPPPPGIGAPQPTPKPPEPTPPAPTVSVPPAAKPTPPPVTQTPELAPKSPTLDERVAEVLARYKSALESRNLDDLKRVWPTLAGTQQENIRDNFQTANRISVEIIDPHIQATTTGATVTFLRRYDMTVGSQRFHNESHTVMEVRRTSGSWVIDSIHFR